VPSSTAGRRNRFAQICCWFSQRGARFSLPSSSNPLQSFFLFSEMQVQPTLLLLLLLSLLADVRGLDEGSEEAKCCRAFCRPQEEEELCVCQDEPVGCTVACCCAWEYGSVLINGATVSAWQCLEPESRQVGGISIGTSTILAIIVPVVVTCCLCGGCLYYLFLKGAEEEREREAREKFGFSDGDADAARPRRGSVVDKIGAGARVVMRRLSEDGGGRRGSLDAVPMGSPGGRRGSQISNASAEGAAGTGAGQGYRRRRSLVEHVGDRAVDGAAGLIRRLSNPNIAQESSTPTYGERNDATGKHLIT